MARLELSTRADGTITTVCRVVLSRRNVLSLLSKLEGFPHGSYRTIANTDCWRDGERADDVLLVLQVEDDTEHYARRPDPPGPMHPDTEAFVRARGGWSKQDG